MPPWKRRSRGEPLFFSRFSRFSSLSARIGRRGAARPRRASSSIGGARGRAPRRLGRVRCADGGMDRGERSAPPPSTGCGERDRARRVAEGRAEHGRVRGVDDDRSTSSRPGVSPRSTPPRSRSASTKGGSTCAGVGSAASGSTGKQADRAGDDRCAQARAPARRPSERCSFGVARGLAADGSGVTLSWFPAGGRAMAADVATFDATGRRAPTAELALRPARFLLSSARPGNVSIDLVGDASRVPLAHPEAVASVDCGAANCELDGGRRSSSASVQEPRAVARPPRTPRCRTSSSRKAATRLDARAELPGRRPARARCRSPRGRAPRGRRLERRA